MLPRPAPSFLPLTVQNEIYDSLSPSSSPPLQIKSLKIGEDIHAAAAAASTDTISIRPRLGWYW